jgi:hypothetical protein
LGGWRGPELTTLTAEGAAMMDFLTRLVDPSGFTPRPG